MESMPTIVSNQKKTDYSWCSFNLKNNKLFKKDKIFNTSSISKQGQYYYYFTMTLHPTLKATEHFT